MHNQHLELIFQFTALCNLNTLQFLNFSPKRTQTRYSKPHLNNRRQGREKRLRSEFALASNAIILRLFIAGAWICQHPGHPLQPWPTAAAHCWDGIFFLLLHTFYTVIWIRKWRIARNTVWRRYTFELNSGNRHWHGPFHIYGYGSLMIIVTLVCLSYILHNLSFSWKIISINHWSHQDAFLMVLKRHQEAS